MICRIALLGVALATAPAAAQTEYRNLDRGRPGSVEDAYPVERYGFEMAGGYRLTRIARGRVQQVFEPELSYGLGASLEVGVATEAATAGLAGFRLSAKYNLTTQRPWLPGLAVRIDGTIPIGSLAGSGAAGFASLLATRSLGRDRLHLNAGASLGRPSAPAAVEPLPQWRVGLALDHTLLRTSTMLVLDVVAEREWGDSEVAIRPGAGFRRQLSPLLVLDGGVRFGPASVGVGFSHAFGVAGLIPGGRR